MSPRQELDERFADWVDGRLSAAECSELEARLAADPSLAAQAQAYRAFVRALRSSATSRSPDSSRSQDSSRSPVAEQRMPEGFAAAVLAALPAHDPSPGVPLGGGPRIRLLPYLASGVAAAAIVTLLLLVDRVQSRIRAPSVETNARLTIRDADRVAKPDELGAQEKEQEKDQSKLRAKPGQQAPSDDARSPLPVKAGLPDQESTGIGEQQARQDLAAGPRSPGPSMKSGGEAKREDSKRKFAEPNDFGSKDLSGSKESGSKESGSKESKDPSGSKQLEQRDGQTRSEGPAPGAPVRGRTAGTPTGVATRPLAGGGAGGTGGGGATKPPAEVAKLELDQVPAKQDPKAGPDLGFFIQSIQSRESPTPESKSAESASDSGTAATAIAGRQGSTGELGELVLTVLLPYGPQPQGNKKLEQAPIATTDGLSRGTDLPGIRGFGAASRSQDDTQDATQWLLARLQEVPNTGNRLPANIQFVARLATEPSSSWRDWRSVADKAGSAENKAAPAPLESMLLVSGDGEQVRDVIRTVTNLARNSQGRVEVGRQNIDRRSIESLVAPPQSVPTPSLRVATQTSQPTSRPWDPMLVWVRVVIGR